MEFKYKGLTDIGKKRETNQDCFRIEELSENCVLMVVCDGMGGAVGGSEASNLAADTFKDYVKLNINKTDNKSELLLEAVRRANLAVCDKAKRDSSLEGMGTTLVSALYDGTHYTCVWVGDSRIYALTAKGIKQISHDHSFVQTLVDSGNITEEEAKLHPNRNIITKAIGTSILLDADIAVMNGDEFCGLLLCSDGLCGYVEESVISAICNKEADVEKCVEMLVNEANENGGIDNITVIVHRTKNIWRED